MKIDSESGEYELEWSKAKILPKHEYSSVVRYDLARYYFQQENYKRALELLTINEEIIFDSLQTENALLKNYFHDLKSIKMACECMLTTDTQPVTNSEWLVNALETCKSQNYKVILKGFYILLF